jgi:hypothetical protein
LVRLCPSLFAFNDLDEEEPDMKMPPPLWYELSSDDTSMINPLPLPSQAKGVESWNVRHSPACRELLCKVVGPYTTVVESTKDVSSV